MDSLSSGADPQDVEQEITALALSNHLVSRYTSLVAVEEKVSRPGDAEKLLEKQKVQPILPAGWVHEKIFAGGADTATSAPLSIFLGLFFLALSALLARMQRRRQ